MDKPPREVFAEHVREALNHLYDPDRLRRSPLAQLFGVAGRYDTPLALRRILAEEIEELEPATGEPSQCRAWRMHDSLLYQYVEQLSPEEAASQIGISPRQLRREQCAALTALTSLLWKKFNLENGPQQAANEASDVEPMTVNHSVVNHELAWLKGTTQRCPTDLEQTLPAVLQIADKIASQRGTHLELATSSSLPFSTAHPVACRQILIDLLSVAIPRAADGAV